jgi:hypothetical protein
VKMPYTAVTAMRMQRLKATFSLADWKESK